MEIKHGFVRLERGSWLNLSIVKKFTADYGPEGYECTISAIANHTYIVQEFQTLEEAQKELDKILRMNYE